MSPNQNDATKTLELVAPYFINSVERTAELQKNCLDAVAGQFREWIALNKKLAIFVPAPVASLFDVAERSFEKGVDAQKSLIDVAVEQSKTAVRISTETQPDFSKVADQVTSMVRKSAEQATAVQKDLAAFAAEETRKASDIVIQQFGLAGTPAADSFKKNLNAVVDLQKTIVDIATKPLKADSAKAK
jgi:hypothetical protein